LNLPRGKGGDIQSARDLLTRDFLFIFLAYFLFSVAYGSLLPTLPLYFSQLSYKDTEIGILAGVFGVAAVALRPLAGGALHRYSAKLLIVSGSFLFGLTFLAFVFLGTAFWPLLVIRLVQGAAFALVSTASVAVVIDNSPVQLRGRSLGYFLLSANVAMAIAPSLSIFFINRFSFQALFLVLSALSFASLVAVARLKKIAVPAREQLPLNANVFLSRNAIPSGLASFGYHVVWGAVSTFFPLLAIEKGAVNPGLLFSAMAVAMIICRTLGSSILDRYDRHKLVMTFLTTSIGGLLLLSFSSTQTMFILAGVIFGISTAFLIPTFMAHAARGSGPSSGAAVGTFLGFCDLGLALGPVIMGAVANSIGYSMMFLCTALIACVNLLYAKFFLVEHKTGQV
jgi:MFS family permease